jgi:bifunctional DNase/RNase
MIQVQVKGIGILPAEGAPVMLLREDIGRRRWLTIRIGVPEAEALLAAREQVAHIRPTTIELLLAVVEALGCDVERVELTALRDGVFHSDLVLDAGVRISARPSDAVAIALLAGAPVVVAEAVLDTAGQEMEVAGDEAVESEEIAEFRTFLDAVTPDDFENLPPE